MRLHPAQNTPVTLDGADLHGRINTGAHAGAYGANDLKTPTDAQAQAGTYKMGRITVQGLRIAIEQPHGSVRTGKGADGKEWSSRMAAHYGYFEGTRGADGDGIDCFVGPFPESENVFVINQRNKGGGFDEHKTMLGFVSERHARGAYLDSYERGWAGLQSMVPLSIPQLRWWIKHGNKRIALTAESLPLEASKPMTTKKIYWTDTQPDGVSYDQVLYELRRMDGPDGLLLDSVTMAEIMEDTDGVIALDALVVENAQLARMSERLRAIMDRSGGAVKVPAVQVSDPFRARGVTNIATVFELSDGQSVSIFFHNPDTAPNKLAPGDEMISWKWLLNKKDITIVVAPEKGQDLNPRLVAQRIMKLAEKNSAAFQKANSKRAERMGNIEAIRGRIAEKEATLNELVAQVEAARLEKDQRVIAAEDEVARRKAAFEAVYVALIDQESGWQRAQTGVDKKFYGLAQAGELSDGGRIIAIAKGGGPFLSIFFGEAVAGSEMVPDNGNPERYATVAARLNAKVEAFVAAKRAEVEAAAVPNPIALEKDQRVIAAEDEARMKIEKDHLQAQANISPARAWMTNTNLDPAGGAQIIETWSAEKAEAVIRHISDGVGSALDAAKAFAADYLQGRIVKTSIGDCIINSTSVGKLVDGGSRKGTLKLAAIPHVPNILIEGTPGEQEGRWEDSSATIKATSIYALVPFTHTFNVGELKVKATVKVGLRKGTPSMVYSLSRVEATLDSAQKKIAPFIAYIQQPVAGLTLAGSKMSDETIMDDANGFVNNTAEDELNIEILAVWDANGNRVSELEDGLPEAVSTSSESAPPVEVYAFKDASDEALGLLRIGAQNPATRSTYKTAVSVEQSADTHGMAIRWEAVSALPTFDDATGGLFGDGDQGHIRGDLTYNGTKLAQVYVREDGMSAFEFELVMSEHIDADEEGWAGWHDAWTDVISKMRDVCDDNGIAQPEESPFGRLYEYEVTEDKEGGWWAKFKNEAMSEMRAWSPDKDEVIAKAEAAIALHKSSPYVGRRWNSLYGGVVESVKLAGYPNSGEGSELYEAKYPDGSYRRFQGSEMDRRIAKDEFDATPEGIKAAQDASAKYQREAEARRAAEEAAKAENDRLDAKIKEFTDSAGYSARDAGKAREVLKTSLNYGNFGGVMRRMEFLEKAVKAGFKTSTEQVKKIKDKTRLQFNRMDQREQNEHEAKQKAAGTKTEYRIGKGAFYTITKTEFDYANYLTGKTAATDPAPTPEPTVTPEPTPSAEPAPLVRPKAAKQHMAFDSDVVEKIKSGEVSADQAEAAGVPINATWPAHRAYVYSKAAEMTRNEFHAALKGRHGMAGPEIDQYYKNSGGKEDISVPSAPVTQTEPAPAANAEDRAFFMSVIDGTHPEILEPELAEKLAQAYERHAGDSEITSLFMQAGNAYTQAMLAAAEGV